MARRSCLPWKGARLRGGCDRTRTQAEMSWVKGEWKGDFQVVELQGEWCLDGSCGWPNRPQVVRKWKCDDEMRSRVR